MLGAIKKVTPLSMLLIIDAMRYAIYFQLAKPNGKYSIG
jgi:hypothetical protein